MKVYSLTLLLILSVFQVCNSQSTKKFNLYLAFNSDKNEMSVVEKTINDSVKIKTFVFSKDIITESFKYGLVVDTNGKVNKDFKHPSTSKNVKITLYHYSYMHDDVQIKDLPQHNVILFEDFINSEFKSFNNILYRASKIFVVDIKNKLTSNTAYEVKL